MFFHSNGFEVNGINNNRMLQGQDYTVDVIDEVVQRMHTQKSMQNTLAIEAENKKWFRKKLPFQSIKSEDLLPGV